MNIANELFVFAESHPQILQIDLVGQFLASKLRAPAIVSAVPPLKYFFPHVIFSQYSDHSFKTISGLDKSDFVCFVNLMLSLRVEFFIHGYLGLPSLYLSLIKLDYLRGFLVGPPRDRLSKFALVVGQEKAKKVIYLSPSLNQNCLVPVLETRSQFTLDWSIY